MLARDDNEQGTAVWAQPYFDTARFDGTASNDRATYSLNGLAIGADAAAGDAFRVGANANIASSQTSLSSPGDRIKVDQYGVGLHALFDNADHWWAVAEASYGWQNARSSRQIDVGAFDPVASARYDGHAIDAALEGGYRFSFDQWHLEPFLGAYYAHVQYDGFTEQGAGDADLDVSGSHARNLQYGPGVRFSGDFGKNPDGTQIHPVLVLRYLHGADDRVSTIDAAFDGASDVGYTVGGVQPARNHWQAALGASFDLTPQASLYVYESVDTATRTTSNAANFGFRWSFSAPAHVSEATAKALRMPVSQQVTMQAAGASGD
jgi:outer membrane autotransporter protein